MHSEELFDIRKDPFFEKMTLHQYSGLGGHVVVPDGVIARQWYMQDLSCKLFVYSFSFVR